VNGESASRGLRWPLRIKEDRRDGVVILELEGRLGHASADRLTAVLGTVIDQGARSLILDLAQVDYISSAGLLAVDLAAKHLAAIDGVLVLCSLPEPLRIAFELAGFLTRYPVEPSRDLAIAAARGGQPRADQSG
jgi:stage II sporulation protein AA (anti-sigma F factor antagonist)